MMRTFLVALLAAVLAAALVAVVFCYFLPCPTRPPEPPGVTPTDEKPTPTCEDIIGLGPREAVVKVKMDTEDRKCKLRTVPNRLPTCVGEELLWQTAYAGGDCTGYSRDLTIQLKPEEDKKDLEIIETGDGWVRAKVPHWPEKCRGMTKCTLKYSVMLHHTDPEKPHLVEDPHIDIWD
jgi:hypothetical protein